MGNCFGTCQERHETYATMVASESVTAEPSIAGLDEEEITHEQVFGVSAALTLHVEDDGEEVAGLDFISHPFIRDEQVVSLLQTMKVMFIMRGVPGSGKSTICSVLRQCYPRAVVCSADHFWMTPEGEYRFDMSRLKEAHNACQNAAYSSCNSGEPQVIIDNTNIRRWEFKYYVDLARRFGYLVFFVEPETPWRFDAERLAAKGKHSVPLNVIEAKIKSFEPCPVPVYFGWFLGPGGSNDLLTRARSVIAALQAAPSLLQRCDLPSDLPLDEFFTWSHQQLHVTSMFCDRGRLPDGASYASQARRHLGQPYQLRVYALLMTKRTIGAAIGPLDASAVALWANGDEAELPRGAKAHVTLGLAPKVRPVQTGLDLIALLRRLQHGQMERAENWSFGELWCSPQAEEGCLLQLKQPIFLDTVFGHCL